MPIICPHVILDAFLHTLDVDNLSVCDRHNSARVYLTVLVVPENGDCSS